MATLDTTTGAKKKVYTVTGPASYAAGGFLHDASADFSWIGFVDVIVATRGVLPPVEYEIDRNVDTAGAEAAGKCVVKLVRHRYDKATMGNVSGQPGGVTVQAAAAADDVSTHTHAYDHDHGAVTSGANAVGSGSAVNAASPAIQTHTHTFTIPPLTATSGAGGSHGHTRAFQYEHSHDKTVAATDVAAVEMGAATNLSGVTFKVVVYGFGKS